MNQEQIHTIKKILESVAKEGTLEDSKIVIPAILETRRKAYQDAVTNMGRYKFDRFGYFAARWVTLNHLLKGTRFHSTTNPFKKFVLLARDISKEEE
tara:strand:- start:495 stop:785 length:291 start_codon:yes stop_codon:yes gene_type:complete